MDKQRLLFSEQAMHQKKTIAPEWLGAEVSEREMDYSQVRAGLPDFVRQSFACFQTDGTMTSIHPRLETILRKPTGEVPHFRPVGLVSANYGLVTHREIFDIVEEGLEQSA